MVWSETEVDERNRRRLTGLDESSSCGLLPWAVNKTKDERSRQSGLEMEPRR